MKKLNNILVSSAGSALLTGCSINNTALLQDR